jgi:hypothetical protein
MSRTCVVYIGRAGRALGIPGFVGLVLILGGVAVGSGAVRVPRPEPAVAPAP